MDNIEIQAKEMINKVYQPMGYLKMNENSNVMWEWAKNRVVEFLDYIIDSLQEGSIAWVHHVKLKEKVLEL